MDTAKNSASLSTLKKVSKAKQAPPVRLSDPFYKRMNAVAKINHRSVPKQLEHMAGIAESVSNLISPEQLLDIQSGLSTLVVEKVAAPKVDKTALFASLDAMRQSGALPQKVTAAKNRYQACERHEGYLERINADGSRDVGQFKGGKFKVAKGLL